MFASSFYGHLPGMGVVVETFEAAYCWGPYPRYFTGALIASTAADPTNTPTWELRPGLIMGKIISTGQWVNYSATATDGSEVAAGVLTIGLRMQDIFTGSNTQKFYGIMVSGGVQAAKLIGLDNMARSQMAGQFYFDDNFSGNHVYPWNRFQTKAASYTVVAADNLSLFDNIGATGSITFTLPAIANGYYFGFRVQADQTVIVASAEGANMVAFNNAVANSVAFQTGGAKIGGLFIVYTNPAGTKWIVESAGAGANTVTVA